MPHTCAAPAGSLRGTGAGCPAYLTSPGECGPGRAAIAPPTPLPRASLGGGWCGAGPRLRPLLRRLRAQPPASASTGALSLPRSGRGGALPGAPVAAVDAPDEGVEERQSALVEEVRRIGTHDGLNVVAFSGGIDSSLVAHLVLAAHGPKRAVACIGVSPSLGARQLAQAREVAEHIGIRLWEVATGEGSIPEYVANEGEACFHCKTALYSTLERVGGAALERAAAEGGRAGGAGREVVLFNGTNADDLTDPTRVGILAATNFSVGSPLAPLTKAEAGLPHWAAAASPCLRSRLALGVLATPEALGKVEAAEAAVRQMMPLRPEQSMRVRVMPDGSGVVEVDAEALAGAEGARAAIGAALAPLGLQPVTVRAFRSGSVAGGASVASSK